jgi:hypothetical protein
MGRYMPVIPAGGRPRQEDPQLEANLGHITRSYLKLGAGGLHL